MVKVINVTTSQITTPEPSITSQLLHFWWIPVVFLVILGLILILIYFLVKKIKERENVLILLSNQRKKLAKQHKDRKRGKHYFKKKKNQPIVCQYIDNGIMHRQVVGYYYGDFFSKEGNRVVRFAVARSSKWFFFPDLKLLLLNRKPFLNIVESIDKETKKPKIIKVELPCNIDHWLDNEILLLGVKSIDKLDRDGLFYIPIMADRKDGQLDPQSFMYEQIKQVIVGEQMVENLDNFVTASKKALDLNTELRGVQRANDSSGNVEENKKH